MNNRRLARRLRLAIRVKSRRGELTADEARRLKAGTRDAKQVEIWKKNLEHNVWGAPWLGKDPELMTGLDWSRIWTWLMDNWPTILKLLLSLLVFLDAPKDSK
jgi:hypothetical protein